MKQLTCEMCGSNDLIKQDGVFVCQSCGCKYSVEEAKKMMVEGTVEVTGSIEIKKCEFDIVGGILQKYNGSSCSVIIPDTVKEIASKAFFNCRYIEVVRLGNNVTSIGDEAFCNCYHLRSITLPEKLLFINRNAFKNCISLEKIAIPYRVYRIDVGTFDGCSRLKEVVFPNGLEYIDYSAFSDCSSLEAIVIPKTVKSIAASSQMTVNGNPYLQKGAFHNCSSLKSITFMSDKVEIEGKHLFYNCSKDLVVDAPENWKIINQKRLLNFQSQDEKQNQSSSGCYIATCVYGSYDCPQVWTLRRYRDNTLGSTWYGRTFIRFYYATSPTLVKWFGNTNWFKNMWKPKLDKMVCKLNKNGVENTPYQDKEW